VLISLKRNNLNIVVTTDYTHLPLSILQHLYMGLEIIKGRIEEAVGLSTTAGGKELWPECYWNVT